MIAHEPSVTCNTLVMLIPLPFGPMHEVDPSALLLLGSVQLGACQQHKLHKALLHVRIAGQLSGQHVLGGQSNSSLHGHKRTHESIECA